MSIFYRSRCRYDGTLSPLPHLREDAIDIMKHVGSNIQHMHPTKYRRFYGTSYWWILPNSWRCSTIIMIWDLITTIWMKIGVTILMNNSLVAYYYYIVYMYVLCITSLLNYNFTYRHYNYSWVRHFVHTHIKIDYTIL
jgi:hypothetical protein